MRQIRKARFAVLPLKIDVSSSTLREAMANGLPVVTTITPSTPKINAERQCLLLSEKEDFIGMKDNMLRLMNSKDLADELRQNAFIRVRERYDNEAIVGKWREVYHSVLENRKSGTPISSEIIHE